MLKRPAYPYMKTMASIRTKACIGRPFRQPNLNEVTISDASPKARTEKVERKFQCGGIRVRHANTFATLPLDRSSEARTFFRCQLCHVLCLPSNYTTTRRQDPALAGKSPSFHRSQTMELCAKICGHDNGAHR